MNSPAKLPVALCLLLCLSGCEVTPAAFSELRRELANRSRFEGWGYGHFDRGGSLLVFRFHTATARRALKEWYGLGVVVPSPSGRRLLARYDRWPLTGRAALESAPQDGLVLFDLDGNVLWQIETSKGFPRFQMLAISFDESKVALSGDRGLYYLDVPSKSVHLVDPTPFDQSMSMSWSPKGDQILYSHRDQVVIQDLARRSRWVVAEGMDATWSPDGQWIAFKTGDRQAVLTSPSGDKRWIPLGSKQVNGRIRWSQESDYFFYSDSQETPLTVMTGIVAALAMSPARFTGRLHVYRVRDGATACVRSNDLEHQVEQYFWIQTKPGRRTLS